MIFNPSYKDMKAIAARCHVLPRVRINDMDSTDGQSLTGVQPSNAITAKESVMFRLTAQLFA
jgi:hypothetical protein